MTRIALDTNILVYLAGVGRTVADEEKVGRIRTILRSLASTATLVAPAQTLGELFVVLRRYALSPEEARAILIEFSGMFAASPSESRTALAAADLVVDHKMQFWDALILTAAIDAGCSVLLSEDMQHGFVTRGLTVVNPLASEMHPKLAVLIDLVR